jgi:ferredoxin--NADP+ reductase
MYVQHRMEAHRDALRGAIDRGAHVYVCGIVGMERGVEEALGAEAVVAMKAAKRWHVETY